MTYGRDMTYREPTDDSDEPQEKPTPWRVDWDNEDGSGTFPYRFRTKRDAEAFARDWKRKMVAADENPREARRVYTWEVVREP